MAVLTTEQINEVMAEVMRDYSGELKEIPVSKPQFLAWLTLVDAELEAAEGSVVSNTPAGPAKTWLLAHTEVGREMMERIERKRKEVL